MSVFIDAHLAHLRASGYSPATIRDRELVLRRLHDQIPFGVGFASTDHLDGWLGHDPDWSAWTRATYAMHIRSFYRWATAAGVLDGDPTVHMAHPRHPDCLPNPVTDEELVAALRRSGEPWHTAIHLAAHGGLRVGEIARLRRHHVSEDAMRVVGKGGHPEVVDTHWAIWEHVESLPAGPLVAGPDGQPVTGRWISAHARKHFDRIGLPDVHMHRFRHWFATTLLDQGYSMRTVQEAMRHRSVISTQGYTKVRNGQRRLAIRSLPIPTQHPAEH